ncbi:hypothetical protein GUITHDRAFT_118445 [Guillardia theta CCMP2712]|uniref:Uncharacterized protein n=1 Tax=Guillardia theta (strain CCMP2712) TaxID=905079 RepID=L1IGS2_GUITC|nr:hypothetical protein GUITHDRAFT_118445 [Guillardia theta CCMP2712]EKX35428.1 hypothetical protein GUITHDRAFT_118445 [Guillardia theta CCMP2712]|eukprot:XP_005822408.1 hypothetical protein GUITHDRAFT_118445 [Guillardia theta CCMP2712]
MIFAMILHIVMYRPASSVAKKIVCDRYNWSMVSACSRKDDEDMTREQVDTSWMCREIGMHCRKSKGQRRRRGHGDAGGVLEKMERAVMEVEVEVVEVVVVMMMVVI